MAPGIACALLPLLATLAASGRPPPAPLPDVSSVHLVFMTHLDLGFTAETRAVCTQMMDHDFPTAFKTAEDLRKRGGEERFRWTQFPWVIQEYLDGYARCSHTNHSRAPENITAMENAIKNNDIIWHGTAVNFMPEILDEDMWAYSLGMASKLNKKYGKTWGTVMGKHSDVPGMSRSALPALAKQGIKAYHIGYNPSCTKQLKSGTPTVFRWRINGTGDEVLTMLDKSYGTDIEVNGTEGHGLGFHRSAIPGAEDIALVFQFNGDNSGVPDADKVVEFWATVKARFPNAKIQASSLDDFAREVFAKGDVAALPLVTGELGDSWIYGVPADPIKVATFREARRALKEAAAAKTIDTASDDYERFMRRLIKGPAEHNWGLNIRYIAKLEKWDDVHWAQLLAQGGWHRKQLEWDAQREWMYPCTNATFAMLNHTCSAPRDGPAPPSTPQWDAFVADLLRRYEAIKNPTLPATSGSAMTPQQVKAMAPMTCAGASVAFSGDDGSVRYLQDLATKHVWIGGPAGNGTQRLAQYEYQTYDQDDCDLFSKEYGATGCSGKLGFGDANVSGGTAGDHPVGRKWLPQLLRAYSTKTSGGCEFVMQVHMRDNAASANYGAPRTVSIKYTFPGTEGALMDITLTWKDKFPTRLPESIWLKFTPEVPANATWQMDVLGHPVDPLDVVAGGTRHVHAVSTGAEVSLPEGRSLRIQTLDVPIVSPGDTDHLLRYIDDQPDVQGGMHFVLTSNLWAIAFPQFFAGGTGSLARFRIHTK